MSQNEQNPKIWDAKLNRQTNPFFKGNILIEALPAIDQWTVARLRKELQFTNPEVPSNGPMTSIQAKLLFLKVCMRRVFIVSARHLRLATIIDDLLRLGYYSRPAIDMCAIGQDFTKVDAPEETEETEDKVLTEDELYIDAGVDKYDRALQLPISTTPAVCIIGWSGSGKSYSIGNVLSLYPQVINHRKSFINAPFKQVVWLKIDCPPKAQPKAICIAILEALDNALGTTYATTITNPINQAKARLLTTKALKDHFVGLLVIDEMQNISEQSNRCDFFNFIVELTNTIQASLVFIGTPKLKKLFSQDFRILRRSTNLGSMDWPTLITKSRDGRNSEFDNFIEHLENFNVTNTSISQEVKDALYYYSQGITDLITKLYFLTQIECLSRNEEFNRTTVKQTFKLHFKALEPVIEALRKNDLEVLEHYADLTITQKEIDNKIDDLVKIADDNLDDLLQCTPEEMSTYDFEVGIQAFAGVFQRLISQVSTSITMDAKQTIDFKSQLYKALLENRKITLSQAFEIANSILNTQE